MKKTVSEDTARQIKSIRNCIPSFQFYQKYQDLSMLGKELVREEFLRETYLTGYFHIGY